MATLVNYDEDLQKAIQLSIQNLSYEQQFQLAQEESEREENRRQKVAAELSHMSYEEQLRLAEEMSLKDAPPRSFFGKHFQELDLSSPEQRVNQLNGRRNHRVKQMSSKASDQSSSDSDSGFGSEDRDLKMALERSQDPSEQSSKEMQDILLALKISERERSSVDLSNGILWNADQDKLLCDELWLYEDDNNVRSKSKKPVRSHQELNDQILLKQLEERSINQPLTPEELESLRPFLEADEMLSNVNGDGVKTLDEIEAELTKVERKKKKKKKPSSPGSSVSGSPTPNDFTLVTRRTETGARPKTIQMIGSQLPAARFSPVQSQLSQSPRSLPRNSPLTWSTTSGGNSCPDFRNPCGRPRGSLRPIIVDGNNVAYQHGKNDRFSAKGLQIVFDYFCDKFDYSSRDIVIVHKPGGFKSQADSDIIESLYKIDVLIKTVLNVPLLVTI